MADDDDDAMTEVLISESHVAVRRLLQRLVRELGHDPRIADAPLTLEELHEAGLLIVEPADPGNARLAESVHAIAPALPILCVSVLDCAQVDIAFSEFLCKPFTFEQFAEAVQRALMRSAPGQATV